MSTAAGGPAGATQVPKERAEFTKLLASNPNYFGNAPHAAAPAPVNVMAGNHTYEQISCVGYNPALKLLEATIQIKLPFGYLGGVCSPGSTEYVRFYVDYGSGWIDVGVAAFNAHDIPNGLDCAKDQEKPLCYVVTRAFEPAAKLCKDPVLPKVRAILSWNFEPPPGMPNWPPVWGSVLDRHFQIKARNPVLGDVLSLVDKAKLKQLPEGLQDAVHNPIPIPEPPPLTLTELAHLYGHAPGAGKAAAAQVESHRFGFAQLNALSAPSGLTAAPLSELQAEWKAASLDLAAALAALENVNANVTYEEVKCLGLDFNLDRLVATFVVKKPGGYSGGNCSRGSTEYVAFWADWDDQCHWQYLGTAPVNVHDYNPLPSDGLWYSAILPVDLSRLKRPCDGGAKIARVRAVLSWATPPSTVDPDKLETWGNRIDTHVQIHPGDVVGVGPAISIIGGIGVAGIDVAGDGMTQPGAVFAFGGGLADPATIGGARKCPFGGRIDVQGPPQMGFKYRLVAQKVGASLSLVNVTTPFEITNWMGAPTTVTPDPATGFVPFTSPLSNIDAILGYFVPSGDDLWEIRIEQWTFGNAFVATTPWMRVQVDNTGPRRRPLLPPFEPPLVTVDIDISASGACKDFVKGTDITGTFVARDIHFGQWSLQTLPSTLGPPAPVPTPALASTAETAPFALGGHGWKLSTVGMQPCGYVVLVHVWDRTIVNSIPGSHNYNYSDVGFCLRESA